MKHDFRRLDGEKLKHLFDERLKERTGLYASGVWRYKELVLPVLPECFVVTRGEGNTGLYESEHVRAYAGSGRLWLKALGENPSGSFKDYGMTAAVSFGRSAGFAKFACSSTGNTSSSLAMYAAFAGASSYVLLPSGGVSANKVLQTVGYGSQLITHNGTYDDGVRFLEENAGRLGWYVCNSVNPIRIEGQKAIVFEIAHALRWQLPDWIVLPGGALSNAASLGKGLGELKSLGLIDRLPRVAVVQAEGASPFHRMVERGDRRLSAEANPVTRASALQIGNPPSWRKALRGVIDAASGVTVAVCDEEIMEAKAVVDRSGIGCEPASAASVAGLRKLIAGGMIHRDETAVCLLTGHMLKDTDALRECREEGAFGTKCQSAPVEIGSLDTSLPALLAADFR